MADTCIHGFASGTCLICQTLQSGPATATKDAGGGDNGKRRRRSAQSAPARPAPASGSGLTPSPVRPDAVVARHQPGTGIGLKLVGFLILAIVALIVVWLVAGFVLAVLRILELVAVAVVAGWLGWKLGVHHGRRTAAKR